MPPETLICWFILCVATTLIINKTLAMLLKYFTVVVLLFVCIFQYKTYIKGSNKIDRKRFFSMMYSGLVTENKNKTRPKGLCVLAQAAKPSETRVVHRSGHLSQY